MLWYAHAFFSSTRNLLNGQFDRPCLILLGPSSVLLGNWPMTGFFLCTAVACPSTEYLHLHSTSLFNARSIAHYYLMQPLEGMLILLYKYDVLEVNMLKLNVTTRYCRHHGKVSHFAIHLNGMGNTQNQKWAHATNSHNYYRRRIMSTTVASHTTICCSQFVQTHQRKPATCCSSLQHNHDVIPIF